MFLARVLQVFINFGIALCERGWLPDFVTRFGMRVLIRQRVDAFRQNGVAKQQELEEAFIANLKQSPIAIETAQANEQHYEVPTSLYKLCLGARMKYSSCYFPRDETTLDQAEIEMFEIYCQRAELVDGMRILDLGCGWGSLSLYLAEKYPKSTIIAISNSKTQKQYIDAQALMLGLRNLTTLTCNINDFDLLTHGDEKRAPVDRIISIEMFEHMKNYELLLQRCARWLTPRGRLLVHIFTFAHHSYHYEVQSASDWMTKYFFAGGTMPAVDLLMRFQKHLLLINHWRVNGVHYSKTLEAWLRKFDERAAQVRQVLADTYGADAVGTWFMRWRMFFMASSELFRLDGGDTFFVSHYQFENRAT